MGCLWGWRSWRWGGMSSKTVARPPLLKPSGEVAIVSKRWGWGVAAGAEFRRSSRMVSFVDIQLRVLGIACFTLGKDSFVAVSSGFSGKKLVFESTIGLNLPAD